MDRVPLAAIAGITIMTVVAIVAAMLSAETPDPQPVPAPPAGYEYCVTADGRGVYFCPVE